MAHIPAKWIIFPILFLGLVVVSLLLTQGWNDKATDPPKAAEAPAVETIPVELATVAVGRIAEVVRAVGTLEANESVMIRPEIAGLVTRVLFTEGQAVEKGMVMIELDDSELKARLDEADAQLEIARLTYGRMKQLLESHNTFVSQQQIDQAISNLRTAEANHNLYRTRLSKTKIRAPFAGYVGIRRISPGDYVQSGQDLVNLEDIRTLKIDFKIPETFLNRLFVGQRVEVTTDAYPGHTFTGEVYALDPRVDSSSRAVRVRATIPNAGAQLRPGLFAHVKLVLQETDQALLIPEEAVVPQRDRTFVYRVQDDIARWTEVSLGIREQGLVQVLGGLEKQDRVVRVGHQKLRDGARVAAAR